MRGDTRSLIHGIINLIVPFFIYDLASLLVGAIQRRGRTRALLGLIFSVGAAALYYMLRFQLHFTLSQLKDMF